MVAGEHSTLSFLPVPKELIFSWSASHNIKLGISLHLKKGVQKNLTVFKEVIYTHIVHQFKGITLIWIMVKGCLIWCFMDAVFHGCCVLVVSSVLVGHTSAQHKLRRLFCHLGIRSCESERTNWLLQSALLLAQHGNCFGLQERGSSSWDVAWENYGH